MRTIETLNDYCRSHNLSLVEGLALISAAVSKATNTQYGVTPEINENKEIGFYVNNSRIINMKPSTITTASKYLEKTALARAIAKEAERLNQDAESQTLTNGTIDEATNNGYFVTLPNLRAFMPLKEAIGQEAKTGCYAIGATLWFSVVSSSVRRGGKPRVILSRRSALLARTIAERFFASYGFIDIKRKAGVKQTILLRAFPSRELQLKYQSYFPTERIVYQKLTSDGTIKRTTRQKAKDMRRQERDR
jgi:hypothetical protein